MEQSMKPRGQQVTNVVLGPKLDEDPMELEVIPSPRWRSRPFPHALMGSGAHTS